MNRLELATYILREFFHHGTASFAREVKFPKDEVLTAVIIANNGKEYKVTGLGAQKLSAAKS